MLGAHRAPPVVLGDQSPAGGGGWAVPGNESVPCACKARAPAI